MNSEQNDVAKATINFSQLHPSGRSVYIETYGCQMNVGDSEVAASIFRQSGWDIAPKIDTADVVLVNTCAIRENAEQKIFGRLAELQAIKRTRRQRLLVGVIGCMAERLKEQLWERADVVAGPDAYRMLPMLVDRAAQGEKAIDVTLSTIETYDDVKPLRLDSNGVSAFVSIMRGCNNFCSYCVVPYTRGRERSRDVASVLAEVRDLLCNGYREVTLLGQNVNSYASNGVSFAQLLEQVAQISPQLRVRFSTSHPKDFSDDILDVMLRNANIARAIHLPAQSGSDDILQRMNRKYTRQWYLDRIQAIRRAIPDCGITTDLIVGFAGETEQDHQQTLSLMKQVGYDFAFMYAYSERPATFASTNLKDDVGAKIKTKRLTEIIGTQNLLSLQSNRADIGRQFEVLIEGRAKKSAQQLYGRTSQNKVAVFDKQPGLNAGEYVQVKVVSVSSATLITEVI